MVSRDEGLPYELWHVPMNWTPSLDYRESFLPHAFFHVTGVLRGFNGSAFGVTREPHGFGVIQPLACSPLFTYQDYHRELVDWYLGFLW